MVTTPKGPIPTFSTAPHLRMWLPQKLRHGSSHGEILIHKLLRAVQFLKLLAGQRMLPELQGFFWWILQGSWPGPTLHSKFSVVSCLCRIGGGVLVVLLFIKECLDKAKGNHEGRLSKHGPLWRPNIEL